MAKQTKDTGVVKKGFKAFRNSVKNDRNALKRLRNCKTCKYFYPEKGEHEEICHSKSVTKYDMVQEGALTYCTYWIPNWVTDDI